MDRAEDYKQGVENTVLDLLGEQLFTLFRCPGTSVESWREVIVELLLRHLLCLLFEDLDNGMGILFHLGELLDKTYLRLRHK